jgi:hypothetical protein
MRARLLTATAIAAAAFSGVAQASVVTETFTGLINSGIDNAGTFGAAGGNLAGDSVTFSFSYDTGLLEAAMNASTDGSGEYVYPSYYDEYVDYAADSAVTESVTINSQTLAITSNAGNGIVYGCTAAFCEGGEATFTTYAQIAGSGAYIETNLITNYSTGDNLLSQTDIDALVNEVMTGTIDIDNGSAQDTLAIGNVYAGSATPEPTTWISLALGFAMVGLLKRRHGLVTCADPQ